MKKVNHEDGFTLVEVLVATLLMIMVVFALYSMFDMSLRVFQLGNNNVKSNASARVSMDRMEREIRSAWNSSSGCNSGTSTGALLDAGSTTNQISFYNCVASGATPVKITYSVNASNQLQRKQGTGATETLASLGSGGSFTLSYFTAGNVSVSTPLTAANTGDVALVRIKVVAKNGDSTQTLTNNAALRNRS